MKYIFTLFLIAGLSLGISAQTNTWTGSISSVWNNAGNWTLGVPNQNHDVVIPAGSSVQLNVNASVKSISVAQNAHMHLMGNLTIAESSIFQTGSTITWESGNLVGPATLENAGTMNVTGSQNRSLLGNITLLNSGTINGLATGDIYVVTAIFNNTGLLHLQTPEGNISYSSGASYVLNNHGIIRKSGEGTSVINCLLSNYGTIEVADGQLSLNHSGIRLFDGQLNVNSGTQLTWDAPLNVLGTQTGTVNGAIVMRSHITVPETYVGSFAFTGNGSVQWESGNILGSGALHNHFLMETTTATNKSLLGYANLFNHATFRLVGTGDVYIVTGTFENTAAGVVEMPTADANFEYSSGSSYVFNNYGLIRRTGSGDALIDCYFTNYGTISVEGGQLLLSNNNVVLDGGIYNVAPATALVFQSGVTVRNTLTGNLQGPIYWNATLRVEEAQTANFQFTGPQEVIWQSGTLSGGGTLINDAKINLAGTSNKQMLEYTVLNNNNLLRITSSGDLYITTGTLNNNEGGIVDLQADTANIQYSAGGSYRFNNYGTLQKTAGAFSMVQCDFHNYGTVHAAFGTLNFNYSTITLHGGTYHVNAGAFLTWNSTTTVTGELNGAVNGEIVAYGTVWIPSEQSATFAFTGTGHLNLSSMSFNGGGTLNNYTRTRVTTTSHKYIYGNTTLNNYGLMYFQSACRLYIVSGILNNDESGTIDLRADGSGIEYLSGASYEFNNYGLLTRSTSEGGSATINCHFTNYGTINVQQGRLDLSNGNIKLETGNYHVASGAVLGTTTAISLNGLLSGAVEGNFVWGGNINTTDEASLNFTGGGEIQWDSGSHTGGGTLKNYYKIGLNSATAKHILGNSRLENHGQMTFRGTNFLNVTSGTIHNAPTGIIDFKADSGGFSYSSGGPYILENEGLITKSEGTNSLTIQVPGFTNSGVLEVLSGTIALIYLQNTEDGTLAGSGTFTLPGSANFSNAGKVAPGAAVGTLSMNGGFKSASTSVLEVNLNGATPGSEHDVLGISGIATLNGSVAVTLGFVPQLGDTFTVLTSTGTLTFGEVMPMTTASINGLEVTFSVTDSGENSVVLTVTDIYPIPPVASAQTVCSGATIADLEAEGENLQWYAFSSGGAPLSANTLLNTGNYFVSQTVSGYESERVTVAVTVNETPLPEAATPQVFEQGATVASLVATGQNLQWFADAESDTPLTSGTILASGTYYCTQTVNGCESSRLAVTVQISAVSDEYPFYADTDGDGYGSGSPVYLPAENPDAPPAGYAVNGTDCDDNDADVYQSAELYIDADSDGYTSGTETVCYGAEIPQGYSAISIGEDCDDNNAESFEGYPFFIDADGDGFGSELTEMVCTDDPNTAPAGFSLNNTDCDDNNADVFQSAELYIDADSDGYTSGTETICYGAEIPQGYSATSNGEDCDDNNAESFEGYPFFIDADADGFGSELTQMVCTDDPNTPPAGFSLSNTDCDDNDADVYQSAELYIDADSDGYTSGTETVCYGAEIPQGYSATSSGEDCDDNNAESFEGYPFFVDADGDGFGSELTQMVCTDDPNTAPAGFSLSNTDCDDNNAEINPGNDEILYNGIDDNCNGELDEGFQILSQVKVAQCGTTLQNIYTSVVLEPKPGATAYRIKVVKAGEPADAAQVIERSIAWFSMTMLESYDYASTYDISVEVQRNGIWLGYYGPVCQVSTPAILDNGSLVVNPTVCGQTLEKIYHSINGTPVSGATGYRFRITDLTNDPHEYTVQTIERPAAWFSLDMLARYNYGTTYEVEIAVKTTGDYTGYSAPCTISTPEAPKLRDFCGTESSPAHIAAPHTSIHSETLSRVTLHRFQVTNMETMQSEHFDQHAYFRLNQIPNFDPEAVYRIRVAVMTAGSWSAFGVPCYIQYGTVAAMRGPEEIAPVTDVRLAPNPFADTFTIGLVNAAEQTVTVRIYDMLGKLLEDKQWAPAQLESVRFGERYPAGVYQVVVSQSDFHKTLRIIKR